MSNQFYIVYPEQRTVSAETIVVWYNDAVASNEIDGDVIDAFSREDATLAALAMEDAGLITLGHAL